MVRQLLTLTFFLASQLGFLIAQSPTQTVRGTVVDMESRYPLTGARVVVTAEDGQVLGAMSAEDGSFKIQNVPVGRVAVDATYLGYEAQNISNVEVTSGREVVLTLQLQETAVQVEGVQVTAQTDGEAKNEMAVISAREFSVAETNLYAGSRGDPGRMASNYAGVQGADDSRNDIVVRGNSPMGVLWRFEGINIPNPNHFSIPGTGGGPVTILNNKYLSNSDFFTGAFPSEYGNSIAGVFDLKMRNGNNERYEFSGQLGFLGTELMAEGPLSKKSKASFLASYRYSTLSLFSFMGINVGTDAIPKYQDAAFRINLPQKNGAQLTFWGVGGTSKIDIVLSTALKPDTTTLLYGENDRDQTFGSTMGIVGATYTRPVNESTFIKASVAASSERVTAFHELFYRHVGSDGFYVLDSLNPLLDYTFRQNKYSAFLFINKKLGRTQTLKAGFNFDLYDMYFVDSVASAITDSNGVAIGQNPWVKRWDTQKMAPLVQPYITYKLRVGSKLTLLAGLTSMYWGVNKNSFSPVEPRIGASCRTGARSKLNFGAGLHSQVLPPYVYYYRPNGDVPAGREINEDIGLMKSLHTVLGYDWMFAKDMRLKAETYYQYLYDIPVSTNPNSAFSVVNAGASFGRLFADTLVNGGTGRNYGVELTVEKFFTKGYYFLVTGSVFDAKYRGQDGVLRNTTFNGRQALNAVIAKEFKIKGKNALQLGGKFTYAGGRWYGPVDRAASAAAAEVVFADSTLNTLQFKPYYRADMKLLYRWNRPKVTHEFAIDLINFLSVQNILKLTYAPGNPTGEPVRTEYQLGFLPIFYYKIDWRGRVRERTDE